MMIDGHGSWTGLPVKIELLCILVKLTHPSKSDWSGGEESERVEAQITMVTILAPALFHVSEYRANFGILDFVSLTFAF